MDINEDDKIEIFKDTQEIIKSNLSLCELTHKAVSDTLLYYEDFTSEKKPSFDNCEISVIESLSFEAARVAAKKHERIAVLNFASAVNPGGGVTVGASAQEEYLCRRSNLYNCLTRQDLYENFYKFHRSKDNTLYSDRVIYSKGITVFKEGEYPRYTDDWLQVDIITSPAPNLRHITHIDEADLSILLKKRIKNILEIAVMNEREVLVLGAYGCGAFRNPPEIVADAFRFLLIDEGYKKRFREIVFAIKRSHKLYCPNLTAFEEAFRGS